MGFASVSTGRLRQGEDGLQSGEGALGTFNFSSVFPPERAMPAFFLDHVRSKQNTALQDKPIFSLS